MPLLGADNFTDTAGTALASHTPTGTGTSWTKHSSFSGDNVIASSNRVRSSASDNVESVYYVATTSATADAIVQADTVKVGTPGSIQNAGPAGRINTGAATYYRFYYSYDAGNGFYFSIINSVVAGSSSLVGIYSLASTGNYTLKLSMIGSSIKGYVDGVERISATNTAISAAGRSGIYFLPISASDANSIQLDNFVAYDSTTFAADTFTDASLTFLNSHTPEVGTGWTRHGSYSTSSAKISNSNRLRAGVASTAYLYYLTGSPIGADYTVNVDLAVVGTPASNTQTGPAGRINTAADTYYRAYLNQNNLTSYLDKVVSGSVTNLGSVFNFGSQTAFKLSMIGSSIKLIVGGTDSITTTDSSITAAGKAGVYGVDDANDAQGIHIDNLSADDYISPSRVPKMVGRIIQALNRLSVR